MRLSDISSVESGRDPSNLVSKIIQIVCFWHYLEHVSLALIYNFKIFKKELKNGVLWLANLRVTQKLLAKWAYREAWQFGRPTEK